MTDKTLFDEFQAVSAKEWKQKIQVDLRGKDYSETLVWESLEGIKVKPFYHEEDSDSTFAFENRKWQIAQAIRVSDEKAANQKSLHALGNGAESLVFELLEPPISWKELLSDIDLSVAPVYLNFQFLEIESVKSLLAYLDGKKCTIYLNIDIIGYFARTGNWYYNEEKDLAILSEIQDLCGNTIRITTVAVDASLYQNAGANTIQQLAYALAHANEYLNKRQTTEIASSSVFKMAVGGNYFFEIAKLRALRWLWKTLSDEYGIAEDCHILAVPTRRNKSIYDYNVNQLRTTTECMAAVLGGADTLYSLPYDVLYKKENGFSERIARNQLLVLQEESYFKDTSNAANGAYYIENLTQQMAEKALQLFKQLEQGGGFLAQLKEGTIQRKIQESAQKEQQLFDSGKLLAIGTNKFQNEADEMHHELELNPFLKKEKRKTLIVPILEKRLAEALEKERLKNEH